MFTGIIEAFGQVASLDPENENLHITINCPFTHELKIDQSVAHNGVCLTVIAIDGSCYTVTAIAETLRKSNLGLLNTNDLVNIERSMVMNGRIDGHLVQGHVDHTAVCKSVKEEGGSWLFTFEYDDYGECITVEKGSICVNGVSLTVVDSGKNHFSVAIIPYTYEHTNFKKITEGSVVNLEFDIIGKYVAKYLQLRS
ncbi:MAG: riboflavin synthase [Bacteroidetes bacterium]|nr:riboflavin synthase [Bacteroidota bacterium]